MNSKNNYPQIFAGKVVFGRHWRPVTIERINEVVGEFPKKKDFIDFYLMYNGGVFSENALLYTDDFYTDSNDYRLLEVLSFLHIPLPDDEDTESYTYSIEKEKARRTGHTAKFDDFVLCHIPFANDAGDDTYWICVKTGEVKFMEYEFMGYNPDNAITVAHSFSDFCKRIRTWE
jgi:hypothetical protein